MLKFVVLSIYSFLLNIYVAIFGNRIEGFPISLLQTNLHFILAGDTIISNKFNHENSLKNFLYIQTELLWCNNNSKKLEELNRKLCYKCM